MPDLAIGPGDRPAQRARRRRREHALVQGHQPGQRRAQWRILHVGQQRLAAAVEQAQVQVARAAGLGLQRAQRLEQLGLGPLPHLADERHRAPQHQRRVEFLAHVAARAPQAEQQRQQQPAQSDRQRAAHHHARQFDRRNGSTRRCGRGRQIGSFSCRVRHGHRNKIRRGHRN